MTDSDDPQELVRSQKLTFSVFSRYSSGIPVGMYNRKGEKMINANYQYLIGAVVVVLIIVCLVYKTSKHKRMRALACFNKATSGRNEPQFLTIYHIARAANIRQEEALKRMEYLVFWRVLVSEQFPTGEKYYRKRGTISFLEYQKEIQKDMLVCS